MGSLLCCMKAVGNVSSCLSAKIPVSGWFRCLLLRSVLMEKSGVSKGDSYFKNHVDSFVWVSWYLTHVVFQMGDGVFENGTS